MSTPSEPDNQPVSGPAADPARDPAVDPAADPAAERPGDRPVELGKPVQPPAEAPFDPYRFGAPDHPIAAEYAPPGYTGPTTPPPAPYSPPPAPHTPPPAPGSGPPPAPYGGPPPNQYGPPGNNPYGPPGNPYAGGPYGPPYNPYGAPPPPVHHGYAQPKAGNGKAIAALILGILAVLLSVASLFDLVLIIPAAIFGFLGLADARGRRVGGRGLALAGLICAGLATVLVVVVTVFYAHVANECTGTTGSARDHCIRTHF